MATKSSALKKGKSGAATHRKRSASAKKNGKQRRPHNASSFQYTSLDELLLEIAAEPRKVMKGGQVTTMSRAERILRTEIEAALGGQVRALAYLLRLIAKQPKLACSERPRTTIFINGALARV